MNKLEKAILSYLESRPDDWKWIRGREVFSKQKTILLFKRDKKFRSLIVGEVVKLATDLFIEGVRSE